jgi:hypothetical protein
MPPTQQAGQLALWTLGVLVWAIVARVGWELGGRLWAFL